MSFTCEGLPRNFKNKPGAGRTLIESNLRPQLASAMEALDPNYSDRMVPVMNRAVASARD
jgi:hypothetical protein